ncbi:hypothetical protein [uncultured Gimesia sp.]|uniref:hypothetical protein n=1 Tax=uncultured Gimesia sp. TaxID=1678688 RepID=UPI00260744B6|nr:hypothetical protein [uncultured Gimesia sp.]
MSIEVTCPACGGSIQIENVSEVVECPLCQMHLEINPETNEPVLVSEDAIEEESENQNSEPETAPEESAETTEADTTAGEMESPVDATPDSGDSEEIQNDAETTSPFAFLPGGNQTKSEKAKPVRPATNFSFLPGGNDDSEEAEPATETIEATSVEAVPEIDKGTAEDILPTEADAVPEEVSAETTSEETISENTAPEEPPAEEPPAEEPVTEETPTEEPVTEESGSETASVEETTTEEMTPEETATEESTTEETSVDETATEEPTVAETKTAETTAESESPVVPQNYRKGKVVPKRLFTLTLTYAIAATILIAMLLYAKYLGDPHQLESLPDLKPPVKNDEIALQLVPENAKLPAGHTLQLGGPGRRYGNVLVTPLRVTRGPIEFEHYTGDATKTRTPSKDVLKLHLKFENVSSDQTFEPLDQKLLLTRVPGKTPESQLRANNFVCRVDQKRTDAERVLVYDMPPSWEWNIKGQNINQETLSQKLGPGESFETYVATNEAGIDSLKGDLVWRLQLRKGYNPVSYRGVTTLIEVMFNSDQIQVESPSQTKEALPTS